MRALAQMSNINEIITYAKDSLFPHNMLAKELCEVTGLRRLHHQSA